MNIQLQRALDRFVGIPLCALFSLINYIRKSRKLVTSPQKILIILLSEMGSLVLAYPMFMSLKQKYPDASIYTLTFAKNKEMLSLLDIIPDKNLFTINDNSFIRFFLSSLNIIYKLRTIQLDVVIDCELFSRISSIFSFLSHAPLLVGFHRHTQEGLYRGSFINRTVLYNPYRHISQQFVTMVEAIESITTPIAKHVSSKTNLDQPPLLSFSEKILALTFTHLHTDFPEIANKRLILIHPSGGVLPIRAWPLENYCELTINFLKHNFAVGVIGLAIDKSLAETIVTHANNPFCINLAGYTKSLKHLLMLFHRASLLITNDGGPGQFAALTSIPTIVLFGPETPLLYQSLGMNIHSFYSPLPCSPCLTAYNHRTSPCDGDNQCLKQILPAQVLKKAREILAIPIINASIV